MVNIMRGNHMNVTMGAFASRLSIQTKIFVSHRWHRIVICIAVQMQFAFNKWDN